MYSKLIYIVGIDEYETPLEAALSYPDAVPKVCLALSDMEDTDWNNLDLEAYYLIICSPYEALLRRGFNEMAIHGQHIIQQLINTMFGQEGLNQANQFFSTYNYQW